MSMMGKRVLSLVLFVSTCAFLPSFGEAQMVPGMTGPGMGGPGIMGPGMMCPMGPEMMGGMGMGMMGMGMMGMGGHGLGLRTEVVRSMFRWRSLFFAQRIRLGITGSQLDETEKLISDYLRYSSQKEADQELLLLDIRNLLLQDKIDLDSVEKKIRALQTVGGDLDVEGIRTLDKMLAMLTSEQKLWLKDISRGMIFPGY